jgi:hypothetical protein
MVDELLLKRSLETLSFPILIEMLEITEEYHLNSLYEVYIKALAESICTETLPKVLIMAMRTPDSITFSFAHL